jgi:hypothetical protein
MKSSFMFIFISLYLIGIKALKYSNKDMIFTQDITQIISKIKNDLEFLKNMNGTSIKYLKHDKVEEFYQYFFSIINENIELELNKNISKTCLDQFKIFFKGIKNRNMSSMFGMHFTLNNIKTSYLLKFSFQST